MEVFSSWLKVDISWPEERQFDFICPDPLPVRFFFTSDGILTTKMATGV